MKRWKMLIGGEQHDARSGRTFERRSPATGEVVGVYPEADAGDVAAAVDVARRTFDEGKWSASPARVRAQILRKLADALRGQADALARHLAEEVGKPIALARGEVLAAADTFDYYGGLALDLHGDAYSQTVPDALGLALREPVGVVGVIIPWNFPLALLAWKLGPALAAGCTVVVKPSHLTPATALDTGRILLELGLPPGVFNVVTSEAENGAVAGGALVGSPLVDKIAFTGSGATGKKVMAGAAATLKKVSLELGGKSPNVVFADAPLDAAVAGAYSGIFMNTGQVCQAGSRLLVQESIADGFVEKLTATIKAKVKLGDPLDAKTNMGPIVSEAQLARVLGYIDQGKKSATLVLGGGRADDAALARGLYVAPTVFSAVPADAAIAREEIFGPVLAVQTFKDEADALRQANDTTYGLAAAVWTQNLSVALRAAKGIRAGTVWVNAYHGMGLADQMPYGGFKQSGMGRELGREGLNEYLEWKSVQIKIR
ncbi:MAG TPA: aldehyde dehydrogenase family protein [Haliangiales bacterium]|nr:aldehyde dehydrogenase family protein [Haliangiales bacterium]